MKKQYTASALVIDFETRSILLMYNKKLNKWLQLGGHIETDEISEESVIREVKEETGVDIHIISRNDFDNSPVPISIERYINRVGDMIVFSISQLLLIRIYLVWKSTNLVGLIKLD